MTNQVEELLIKHEGLRLKPYIDTVGKLTIGYGRNLHDSGITHDEAMYMLKNDISRSETELVDNFPWFISLSQTRQTALIDMIFNLGLPRFKQFKKMITAIEDHDFDTAADEALDSKWARQVGRRAIELARMMREG